MTSGMLQQNLLTLPTRLSGLPGGSGLRAWRRPSATRAQPQARQLTTGTTAIYQLERGAVGSPAHAAPSTQQRKPQLREPEPFIAYEVIQGALVRYSNADGKQPPTAVLVHGILGSRRNMQSFARRIVQGFPSWQVILVDLRCHGDSAAISGSLSKPHSVESAAADVTRLLAALKLFPEVLIGHSFGGKCVLSICDQFGKQATRLPRPVKAWILDALPGEVRSGEMGQQDRPADLITALLNTQLPLPNRQALIGSLESQGFSNAVAMWAAMNLVPFNGDSSQLVWGFDLLGISQMYRSYESTQLWDILSRRMEGLSISFVKAERSTFRWGGGDEQRIRSLGHDVHLLRNSGHWCHSDNPEGLFDILAPSFGATPPFGNILSLN